MSHPCACCRLRFAHASELEAHVHEEHADRTPVEERRETIPASRHREPLRDPRGGVVRLPW